MESYEAVVHVAAATGVTNPDSLFETMVGLLDVADRLDYVRRVHQIDADNFGRLFPEWQGQDCKPWTLVVDRVAQDVSNAGTELNRWRVFFRKPEGFKHAPSVPTGWANSGWVPGFVAARAAELVGREVRAWWRTFPIDDGKKATEMLWIEPVAGEALGSSLTQAPPLARGSEGRAPDGDSGAAPVGVAGDSGGVSVAAADPETIVDILAAIKGLAPSQQKEAADWIKAKQWPPVKAMSAVQAAATQAKVYELQSELAEMEEPF